MTDEKKVIIRKSPEVGRLWEVSVDGVDLADFISELTFKIVAGRDGPLAQLDIRMILAPDELDVHIPAEVKLKIEELK